MRILDTDEMTGICSICGEIVEPEPMILVGGGRIVFPIAPDRAFEPDHLSVMHRSCFTKLKNEVRRR